MHQKNMDCQKSLGNSFKKRVRFVGMGVVFEDDEEKKASSTV